MGTHSLAEQGQGAQRLVRSVDAALLHPRVHDLLKLSDVYYRPDKMPGLLPLVHFG